MKTYFLFTVFLLITLLLASCSPTGRVIEEKQPVKIGVIIPLTGKAAGFGEPIRNGLELALEQVNIANDKIELIYENEACDPKQAVAAYYSLTNVKGVKNIIGAGCSVSTLAIAPLAEKDKIIVFTPSAAAESITQAGDYIFRNHGRTSIEMEKLADYALKKYRTFAIIYDGSNDATALDKTYFEKYIELKGGRIVFAADSQNEKNDFRTILLKLKEQKDDVEAVLLAELNLEPVVKQMNELGINKPLLTEKSIEIPGVISATGDLAEGIVYAVADCDESTNPAFWNKYKERYNETPPVWAAQAYDNLMILAKIFDKCNPDNTECVKNELYKIKDYPGAAGLTSFDENGDAIKNIIIKQVQSGKFVKID